MRLAVALAGLIVLALGWVGRPNPRASGARSPEAFVERADAFIEAGGLEADCSEGTPRLELHPEAVSARDLAWYSESWLARDVDRFGRDPEDFGWAFLLDADCRLRGVHPSVHAIELPFSQPVRWRGRLLYGGRATAGILRSRDRTISLRRAMLPTGAAAEGHTAVGSGESLIQEGAVLLHFGDPAHPAARLFSVAHESGDTVILERRSGATTPPGTVLWNGIPLEAGARLRLESGDWVHLRAPASRANEQPQDETFVVLGSENLEAASVVRRRNDRWERTSDDPGLGRVRVPPTIRTQPWIDGVADDMNRALRRLPRAQAEREAGAFDVELGVRRDLQLRLDRVLREGVEDLGKRRGGDTDFGAGITVLDGRSGDVLAMATWSGGEAPAMGNENLRRHPIGSAMKPFVFAAVLDAFPRLGTMELEGHPPERRHRGLFQCELPVGYQWLEGHGERLDVEGALEVSCNRFAIELATLSLAANGRSHDLRPTAAVRTDPRAPWLMDESAGSLWIEGRALRELPDLSQFVVPGGTSETCAALDRLDQVAWRSALGDVTGAATARTADLFDDPSRALRGIDVTPWQPVLDRLARGADRETSWAIRSSFRGSSPERVDLALDSITRLRADWISFLLGGGTSVWTNVQLAEATARLVTGRRVEARFASRVVPAGDLARAPERIDAPLLPVAASARERVLEGMRRVVEGRRGTARSLAAGLEDLRREFRDDRVVLFAKTGSPVTERSVPGTVASTLERLVVRRHLELRGGRIYAGNGGDRAPWTRTRDASGRSRFIDILAAAVARGEGRRAGLGAILDVLDGLGRQLENGTQEDELEGPLRVVDGRLHLDRSDRLFRSRMTRGMAGTLVMAAVRVPGEARSGSPDVHDLSDASTGVVVAVVHVDVGPGSPAAVQLARRVLPELAPFLR